MSLNHDDHFSQIRALLQKQGTLDNWHQFVEFMNQIESDHKPFLKKYGTYIATALQNWPDECRRLHVERTKPFIFQFGRILQMEISPNITIKDMKALLKPFTKKMLENYTGFYLTGVRRYGLQCLKLFTEKLPKDLKHIFITTFVTYNYKRGEMTHEGIREVLGWLFDTYQNSLVTLGLGSKDYDDERSIDEERDVVWSTFMNWAAQLTQLKHLYCLSRVKGPSNEWNGNEPSEDWGVKILESEHLTQLETLSLIYPPKFPPPYDILMAREASLNLKRLKLLEINEEDVQPLLTAPNLINIKVWDLRSNFQVFDPTSWDQNSIASWQHHIKIARGDDVGIHPALRQQKILFGYDYDVSAIHDIVFDENEQLIPSTAIESLYISKAYLDPIEPINQYIDALIAYGMDAYPNLKRLHLNVQLTPTQFYKISDSALLNIPSFEWAFDIFLNDPIKMKTYIEMANDTQLAMKLRWVAWYSFIHPTYDRYTIKNHKQRAKTLGLKGYSKLRAHEYKDFLFKALPEDMPLDQAPEALSWGVGWTNDD